jgi:hypothetical protein
VSVKVFVVVGVCVFGLLFSGVLSLRSRAGVLIVVRVDGLDGIVGGMRVFGVDGRIFLVWVAVCFV